MKTDLLKIESTAIRWLIRRDMQAVLRMEMQNDSPWTDSDWVTAMTQRNVIGMVIEDQFRRVVGAMLYELHKNTINLWRVLVDEDCRGQGVGTDMVLRVRDKLSQQRRDTVICCVGERNRPMLELLKSCGFIVHATERTDLGPFRDDLMIEMRFVLDREEFFDEDECCEGRR